MRYLCQIEDERVLFSDRKDFLGALEQSQIVVVHPRNVDSPEITGSVSMLKPHATSMPTSREASFVV